MILMDSDSASKKLYIAVGYVSSPDRVGGMACPDGGRRLTTWGLSPVPSGQSWPVGGITGNVIRFADLRGYFDSLSTKPGGFGQVMGKKQRLAAIPRVA